MTGFIAGEASLDQIVDAIRARAVPELVLLFGSRADGRAREDSDYDLMVVLRDGTDLEGNRRDIYAGLETVGIGADVLVRSVSQYERRQSDPGFLDWLASRNGVLLYSSGAVPQRSSGPTRVREQPYEGLRRWVERAAEDFRVAESSLATADPPSGAICFHAHGCVEKLLKALIILRGTYPPRTHDLPQLNSLQMADVRNNRAVNDACVLLQRLYSGSRYPDEPMPTVDDARNALASARVVREFLLPMLAQK